MISLHPNQFSLMPQLTILIILINICHKCLSSIIALLLLYCFVIYVNFFTFLTSFYKFYWKKKNLFSLMKYDSHRGKYIGFSLCISWYILALCMKYSRINKTSGSEFSDVFTTAIDFYRRIRRFLLFISLAQNRLFTAEQRVFDKEDSFIS